MSTMHLGTATPRNKTYAMYLVNGVPTVYVAKNEDGKFIEQTTKTFKSRASMRQYVNACVHGNN